MNQAKVKYYKKIILDFAILLKESLGVFCSEPVSESPLLTTPIIPADDLIWDYKRIPEESSYGFLK
jgi:hypothetical protein